MESALGLPTVHRCPKYFLIVYLLIVLPISIVLTLRSVNQITRESDSPLTTINSWFGPQFSLDFNYNPHILDDYVYGMLVIDGLQVKIS